MLIETVKDELAHSSPKAAAATHPAPAVRTKLATCNVHNLALPNVRYYPDERPYSDREYDRKVRWLGEQIANLGADFVAFQEVFHQAALEAVIARSPLSRARVVVENLDPEMVHRPRVGFATRLPVLGEPTFIRDIPEDARLAFEEGPSHASLQVPVTTFCRPVLRVEIGLWGREPRGGDRAIVYIVHLKSMTPEALPREDLRDPMTHARAQARAQIRRTVEAAGIRSLVRRDIQGATTPVIVLGDCNAGNPSVVAQIMSGPSPSRFDSMPRKKDLWDRTLYDAVDLQSKQSLSSTYYTHIFDGKYEQLDHALLSEEFYEHNPRRIAQVEYVRLFTDHLVDRTLCSDEVPHWISDHGWVVVTLRRDHGPAFRAAEDIEPAPAAV